MFDRISVKISETVEILKKLGYTCEDVSPREFHDYVTGETPTGDTITLEDILQNEYLMVHEIVEISELKKKGIPITKQTIMDFYPKTTYEVHLTATEYELTHALNKKDYAWIKLRMAHAKNWLRDKNLPKELLPRCKSLIKKFAKYLH